MLRQVSTTAATFLKGVFTGAFFFKTSGLSRSIKDLLLANSLEAHKGRVSQSKEVKRNHGDKKRRKLNRKTFLSSALFNATKPAAHRNSCVLSFTGQVLDRGAHMHKPECTCEGCSREQCLLACITAGCARQRRPAPAEDAGPAVQAQAAWHASQRYRVEQVLFLSSL